LPSTVQLQLPMQAGAERIEQAVSGACAFQFLDGTVSAALQAQPYSGETKRPFTSPDTFMSEADKTASDEEIAQPPATVFGVFVALYGEESQFRQQMPLSENARVTPVQPLEAAPWCGSGTVRVLRNIPMAGQKEYIEELRVAICRSGGTCTLAVQAALTLVAGFPVGNLLMEVLYIFTQASPDDPIIFNAWGHAQPGRAHDILMDMVRQGADGYVDTARRFLQPIPHELLHPPGPGDPVERPTSSSIPEVLLAPANSPASPERSRPEEGPLQWMWLDSNPPPLLGLRLLTGLSPLRWSRKGPPTSVAAELASQKSGRGVRVRVPGGDVETFPDAHAASQWIREAFCSKQGCQPPPGEVKKEEPLILQWMWALSLPGIQSLATLNPLGWSPARPALAVAAELALQEGDRGVLLRTKEKIESFPDAQAAVCWIRERLSAEQVDFAKCSVALLTLGQAVLNLKGG